MQRLAAALRAASAPGIPEKDRKRLAAAVKRAQRGLCKAERRTAAQLAARPAVRVRRASKQLRASAEQRRMEDRIAGIWSSWVVPQNVGRGRRS